MCLGENLPINKTLKRLHCGFYFSVLDMRRGYSIYRVQNFSSKERINQIWKKITKNFLNKCICF